MKTSPALGKVAAFITRDAITREADAGRELLVFQHPTAGIQLPAGTVEPGEAPESAVLRETWEESGLTAVTIAAHLATIPQALALSEHLLLERCVPQSDPCPESATLNDVLLTRGHAVYVIGVTDDYCHVSYRSILTDAGFQPNFGKTGWLPRRLLTTDVQRDLFHLTTTAPTPDRWSVEADGHTFSLYWTPLARDVGLIAPQAAWLDAVYERLNRR